MTPNERIRLAMDLLRRANKQDDLSPDQREAARRAARNLIRSRPTEIVELRRHWLGSTKLPR
jgi:hypothetical protein